MKHIRTKSILLIFTVTLLLVGMLPNTYVQAAIDTMPAINGLSAVTIDAQTGEIIYTKGLDDKRYPASMTKLMTALLFAENKTKTDAIKYTQSAKSQPQYSLNIDIKKMNIGETMTGEDVMKALLLFSGNDSAYMIADAVSGSHQDFAKLMNDRAQKLGLKTTKFVTPNGIHDDEHYTTPYEMAIVAREAYKNPWVREVMALSKDTIRFSDGKTALIENRNKVVGKNGCIGGKTGYTSPAGRCLAAIYERNGRIIIGVVMKSAYDSEDSFVFKDMETIIEWSYKQKPAQLYKMDTVIETQTLTYKPFKYFGPEKTVEVPVILKDEISYFDNDVNKKELKTEKAVSTLDAWNLSTETKAGTLTVTQRGLSKTYDLYPTINTKQIVDSNKKLYVFTASGVFALLLAVVILVIVAARGFSKKGYRYR